MLYASNQTLCQLCIYVSQLCPNKQLYCTMDISQFDMVPRGFLCHFIGLSDVDTYLRWTHRQGCQQDFKFPRFAIIISRQEIEQIIKGSLSANFIFLSIPKKLPHVPLPLAIIRDSPASLGPVPKVFIFGRNDYTEPK